MKYLTRLLFLLSLFVADPVFAASRFWVPLVVTGAVSGTGGLCRLTVNNTASLTSGNAVIVAGILGATACDGTTTVTTVVDTTHIEVNLAFGVAYTSGGTVAGGNWNSTGTGNWSASSGGSGGQTIPGSADTVTFDGSSGGGTVIVNAPNNPSGAAQVNITSITSGAFTGTLDFSVNNNNVTLQSYTNTGTTTRTLSMGNGIWTFTGASGTPWNFSLITGLTFNANSSNLTFTATSTTSRTISALALTYATITIAPNTGGGSTNLSIGAATIGTLNVTGPNYVIFPVSTMTIGAFSFTGTSGSEVLVQTASNGSQATISTATGTPNMTWAGIREMLFTGGATFTASNSFDLGHNTGIVITPPGATVRTGFGYASFYP